MNNASSVVRQLAADQDPDLIMSRLYNLMFGDSIVFSDGNGWAVMTHVLRWRTDSVDGSSDYQHTICTPLGSVIFASSLDEKPLRATFSIVSEDDDNIGEWTWSIQIRGRDRSDDFEFTLEHPPRVASA